MTAVSATTVPPAAAAKGYSSTATYNFNQASSTYLRVTFSYFPSAFYSLQLDSLMSNPSRNCAGYTIRNNTISNNRGRGAGLQAAY